MESSDNRSATQRRQVFLISRSVDYETLKELRKLPIFRGRSVQGGMVAQAENRRVRPSNELAARTIGYLNLGNEGL